MLEASGASMPGEFSNGGCHRDILSLHPYRHPSINRWILVLGNISGHQKIQECPERCGSQSFVGHQASEEYGVQTCRDRSWDPAKVYDWRMGRYLQKSHDIFNFQSQMACGWKHIYLYISYGWIGKLSHKFSHIMICKSRGEIQNICTCMTWEAFGVKQGKWNHDGLD